MKNIILILLIIIVSLSSCSDDFLDRGSLTQLAAGNFWQNEKDAQLGVNGIYDALQARILYSGNLNAVAGLQQYDSFADNTFINYKYEGPGNFVEARLDPSAPFFLNFWTANYAGIGRANTAIENIVKINKVSMHK